MENNSPMSLGERAGTMAPRLGTIAISPSASNWRSASRTGMRLTWYCVAIASWRS